MRYEQQCRQEHYTTCKMIPRQETQMITCQKTIMVPEQRVVCEPYTTCKMVPEERCHTVKKAICRMVCEEVVCQVPHTTCKMIPEECVRQIPVTTCRMEATCGTRTCVRVEKYLEPMCEPMGCETSFVPVHRTHLGECLNPRRLYR